MDKFSLNVYGRDGVEKVFSTDNLSLGLAKEALKLEDKVEELKGKKLSNAQECLVVISTLIEPIILKLFPTMTAEELDRCELKDVVNVYKMVCNYAKSGELTKGLEL